MTTDGRSALLYIYKFNIKDQFWVWWDCGRGTSWSI